MSGRRVLVAGCEGLWIGSEKGGRFEGEVEDDEREEVNLTNFEREQSDDIYTTGVEYKYGELEKLVVPYFLN
jgi:hypothetical protein